MHDIILNMPGYLVDPLANALSVTFSPFGDISSTNVQSALQEVATEKATVVTTNNLSSQISSVEGVALLGL